MSNNKAISFKSYELHLSIDYFCNGSHEHVSHNHLETISGSSIKEIMKKLQLKYKMNDVELVDDVLYWPISDSIDDPVTSEQMSGSFEYVETIVHPFDIREVEKELKQIEKAEAV